MADAPTKATSVVSVLDPSRQYTMHLIPKKSSKGVRMVHAPSEHLRIAQKALLEQFYKNTGEDSMHESNIAYVPGKGFVKAIKEMHLTQDHMVSEDLKNYYHQVNGGKLTGALLGALKNTAYTKAEFHEELMRLTQYAIQRLVALNTNLDRGARVYLHVADVFSTLMAAHDLSAACHKEPTVYLTDATVTDFIKAVEDNPPASEERVCQSEYLSSMELRAIDTIYTILETQSAEFPIKLPRRVVSYADHLTKALMRSSSGMRYGWRPLVKSRPHRIIDKYKNALPEAAIQRSHWYGTDVLSLPKTGEGPLVDVASPIIVVYLSLARELTAAPILINYEAYGDLKISTMRTASVVLSDTLLDNNDIVPAQQEMMKIIDKYGYIKLGDMQGMLWEQGIKAKRLSLSNYIPLVSMLADTEKASVKTRFMHGLPQGARTSSFLANMVANSLLERLDEGFAEMESISGPKYYKNLRTIVYSDNVYSLFDTVVEKATYDYSGRAKLPSETTFNKACAQVRQVIVDSVEEIGLALNTSKSTIQSGDDKKLLGLLLNKNGNVRVPRRRVYETNQILIALDKANGQPINYKGHTYSAKDKRRLIGLLEWNKSVGRDGYSQTVYLPNKKSRTSGILRKTV